MATRPVLKRTLLTTAELHAEMIRGDFPKPTISSRGTVVWREEHVDVRCAPLFRRPELKGTGPIARVARLDDLVMLMAAKRMKSGLLRRSAAR